MVNEELSTVGKFCRELFYNFMEPSPCEVN